MRKQVTTLITLATLLAALSIANAAPLATSFTYQGELQVSSVPANGVYDFQFRLFDTLSGDGTIVVQEVLVENATVTNGIFNVELDFGAGPFAGDQLWLEIGVRDGASVGSYTGLVPRQKLTAAPYALHARKVGTGAVASSEIADGSVSSVDINPTQVQRRVSGSCDSGTYLAGINEDGSVLCALLPLGLARTLDATGAVGKYTSIAIRPASGLPMISYYDATNLDLKVYDCSNAACSAGTARTLDATGTVGQYTSIAIRPASGLPIISYYDGSNVDLKVYDCTNTDCSAGTARTLDSTGSMGQYTSIAIRPASGLPMISYYDATNADLKVYDCSNAACSAGTVRTLDAAGFVGFYTSIAVRPTSGLPIISYYDSTDFDLKVYDCTNTVCSAGTVRPQDTAGAVGLYTGIAIRPASGLPIISYWDGTNDDLKVYSCGDSQCEN